MVPSAGSLYKGGRLPALVSQIDIAEMSSEGVFCGEPPWVVCAAELERLAVFQLLSFAGNFSLRRPRACLSIALKKRFARFQIFPLGEELEIARLHVEAA